MNGPEHAGERERELYEGEEEAKLPAIIWQP